MNLERRRELQELSRQPGKCMLNGNPAHISGVVLPTAHIVNDKTGMGASWSWEATERILLKGGKFRT